MSIASALNAGVNSFMKMEDYKQKQELRDLKKESYNLRNEGYRLDNRYSRDTLDTRVAQQEADLGYKEAREDKKRSEAYVAENTKQFLIDKQESAADLMHNKALTERERLRRQGALADSAESQARFDEKTEEARVAAQKAASGATEAEERGNKVDAVKTLLGDNYERVDGNTEAFIENEANAGMMNGVLDTAGYDQFDFGYADGNVVLTPKGQEPSDDDTVMSESQFSKLVFGKDDEVTQAVAQRNLEEDTVDRAGRRIVQGEEETTAEAQRRRDQANENARISEGVAPTLSTLQKRRDELQAELEEQRGFSLGTPGQSVYEQADEAASGGSPRAELAQVNQSIKDLKGEFGRELDRTPEEWREVSSGHDDTVNNEDERIQQGLRGLGQTVRRSNMEADAAGEETTSLQTLRTALGDNSGDRFTQTPAERQEDRLDAAQNNRKMADIVEGTVERGAKPYLDAAQSDPDDAGYSEQEVAEAASSVSNALYDNDAAIQVGAGGPQQQLRVSSLVNISIAAGLESGTPAGRYMSGFLKGENPETISVAADFASEDVLSKLDAEDRPKAVQAVIRLMEQGDSRGRQYNATQAKTAVTDRINQGGF